jgi:hypothetical protein
MNKSNLLFAVFITALISGQLFAVRPVSFSSTGFDASSKGFDPYSKLNARRPGDIGEGAYYHRNLISIINNRYQDTCLDVEDKFNLLELRKTILFVAKIIKRYAYPFGWRNETTRNQLSDSTYDAILAASGVAPAQFEKEFLPAMNLIFSCGQNVYKLNRKNPKYSAFEALAKQLGTKDYHPAVRIAVAYATAQTIIKSVEGAAKNIDSLGTILRRVLESLGINVPKRDDKIFEALGQYTDNAINSKSSNVLLWVVGGGLAVLTTAAIIYAVQ